MPVSITTDQVWREVEKASFAVLGMVTARGEARTVGIVYTVRDRRLYIGSDRSAWKVRHIQGRPEVSITVTIPKRIPFLPWIPIPAATITFQGEGSICSLEKAPEDVRRGLLDGLEMEEGAVEASCIIEVRPRGRFLTYGIGVSLATMRVPDAAMGQAPV